MTIRGLTFTVKGGEGSGWYGPPKGTHVSNVVTPTQREEVLRQLKGRTLWMRGKIGISLVEPVLEPGQTQHIHTLAGVETTAAKTQKWSIDDLPELVRHPNSIGNLSMRIWRLVPRRGESTVVVKFDW